MPGITGLKKQILYDSIILNGYLRGNKICKSKIENIQAGKRVGFISVVSVFEIYVGAFLSPKPTDSFKDIREILTYFQSPLDIDDAAAQKAAYLFAQLRRTNETIGLNDLFIAATALTTGLPVATLNKKHFSSIPKLKLI